MSEFEGLRVLITGGSSGIGLATADLFHSMGSRVAVLDRQPLPERTEFFSAVAELADDRAVRQAIHELATTLGGLDILVNNAGIGAQGTVEDNDDAQWHHVLDINVLGIVRATRAALPHLRRSDCAAIVNTCSIAATVGLPQRALYSASKGAVLSLTRAMAADLLPDGIRVNAVNPGTADTPWIGRLLDATGSPDDERMHLEARQPHGRLVSGAEVARAIAYMAAPSSGSTTGSTIAVDGGMDRLRLRGQSAGQGVTATSPADFVNSDSARRTGGLRPPVSAQRSPRRG